MRLTTKNAVAVGRIGEIIITASPLFKSYILYNPATRRISLTSDDPRNNSATAKDLAQQGFMNIPNMRPAFGTGITFSICDDCNLACIYCFSSHSRSRKKMSFTAAEPYLAELFVKNKDKDLQIGFFGLGEPTLNMDFIRNVVSYVNKRNLDSFVHYTITTNCTMNEEDLDFLISKGFYICAAIDGMEKIQELQRPSAAPHPDSAQKIIQNIAKIAANTSKFHTRTTVTNYNIKHLDEVIHFLHDMGVKNINIDPVTLAGKCKNTEEILPTPHGFFQAFKKATTTAEKLEVTLSTECVRKLSDLSSGHYCSAMSGDMLVLTTDLNRSFCYETLDSHIKSPFIDYSFTTRNISDGLTPFTKPTALPAIPCTTCALKYICHGSCPKRAWTPDNTFDKPYIWQCNLSKLLIPFIIEKIAVETFPSEVITSHEPEKLAPSRFN